MCHLSSLTSHGDCGQDTTRKEHTKATPTLPLTLTLTLTPTLLLTRPARPLYILHVGRLLAVLPSTSLRLGRALVP